MKTNHFFILICLFLLIVGLFTPGLTVAQEKIIIESDYRLDQTLTDLGNPKGKYFEFSMPLNESKIFRGEDSTLDPGKPVRKMRKIFVYIPALYEDGLCLAGIPDIVIQKYSKKPLRKR